MKENNMNETPKCPECNCIYTYQDQDQIVCPECFFQWSPTNEDNKEIDFKDANGNQLKDGDDVVLVKNLKVKGYKKQLKIGTKVKNIRLVDGDHNIDCKINDFGSMKLKSQFVKKL
jgi:protein PhnA